MNLSSGGYDRTIELVFENIEFRCGLNKHSCRLGISGLLINVDVVGQDLCWAQGATSGHFSLKQ